MYKQTEMRAPAVKKASVILGLLCLVMASSAFATPAQILFIRHAEKYNDDEITLSDVGYRRAKKLANFFLKNPELNQYGDPVAIYAAAPVDQWGSMRPIETVTPLAKKLGISINTDYTRDDEDEIVEEILESKEYKNRTVVISWVRQELPSLAKAFGAKDVPKKWHSDTFDRVWKVEFDHGKAGEVIDIPQNLLDGDSDW
jgi:hypothetical protein